MTPKNTSGNNVQIDVELVRQLLAEQFPQWAQLPLIPAVPQGWDNRTFRLGTDLSVRLPSAEGYTPQIEKEQRWLPFLAPQLPLPVPNPVALGQPGAGFPWNWSVYRWIEGETASHERIADLSEFATSLAHFLTALQSIEASEGPPPGLHTGYRGGPLTTYDAETRQTIEILGNEVDGKAATEIWEAALAAQWNNDPVWFHGDIAINNLLVREGRLNAIIDFGCAGVGDPACEVVIAWTLFSGASREAFRAALPLDEATWIRGRGWALWKALITVADQDQVKAIDARRVLAEIMTEYNHQK